MFRRLQKNTWKFPGSILKYRQNTEEGTGMTITIDTSRCIGCGMCAYAAPEVFRIVGKYSTVTAPPEKGRESRVRDAANGCPVNAIAIRRD